MRDSDIRVIEIHPLFSIERTREPCNVMQDQVTLCHVKARTETRGGKISFGWGAISLSHFWAFQSNTLSIEQKDHAMRALVSGFCQALASNREFGHPIDLFLAGKKELSRLCREISEAASLADEIPMLAALVCASPANAALHDAFGIASEISRYDGYSSDFMTHDLSRYLGKHFRGIYFEGADCGWKMGLDLLAGRISLVAAKVFKWVKANAAAPDNAVNVPEIAPLGEGIAPWRHVFACLRVLKFGGWISVHSEYEHMPAAQLLRQTRLDLDFLHRAMEASKSIAS
jgi:hypothetical protein